MNIDANSVKYVFLLANVTTTTTTTTLPTIFLGATVYQNIKDVTTKKPKMGYYKGEMLRF